MRQDTIQINSFNTIERPLEVSKLIFRSPEPTDALSIEKLIRASRNLDVNSIYSYLLLATHFSETCLVVLYDSKVIGVTCGYFIPEEPSHLFVWQITTDQAFRQQGIAAQMLEHLILKFSHRIQALQATVCVNDEIANNFFRSFARKRQLLLEEQLLFPAHYFGEQLHDDECLFKMALT